MRRAASASDVLAKLHETHEQLFADKIMTEDDWVQHRRASHRYRPQPGTLMRVVWGYASFLIVVPLLSIAVGVYYITLVQHHGWPMLSLESVSAFFSSITFSLSLLMVFRTNSAYARWWEARIIVGKLVSLAHSLMHQAVAYFPPSDGHLVAALARWTAASLYVAKSMVRKSADLRSELDGLLTPEELEWLMGLQLRTLGVAAAMSSIIAAAQMDPQLRARMDSLIELYTFSADGLGRIYNTAIPSAYTRHTSRFLLCYILVLPLMLWPMAKWATPVIAFVVAFLLLGVENIGAQIEEPFHVIAFNAFCAAVQRNVFEAASMHASSSSNGGQLGANAPVVTGLARSSAAGGCGCAQQAKGTDTAAASPVWHHAAGDAAACTRRSISATDRAAAAAAAAGVGAPVVASLHVVGPDSQRVHASSSQSWLMAPGHDLAPRPRPPQHTE